MTHLPLPGLLAEAFRHVEVHEDCRFATEREATAEIHLQAGLAEAGRPEITAYFGAIGKPA